MIMKRLYVYFILSILLVSSTISAKTINLYAEPKTDSRVASTMNTETGVTIVYTPKSGEWIKVANPNNGDVGWVKSSDLDGNIYKMRVFTSGNGTQSYNTYQFGIGNNQFNQKQLENEMRHFEQQQRMMQIHMAHMFNDMFYFTQPIFVPVVMGAEQPNLQKPASAKSHHVTQPVETTQTKTR